MEEFLTLEWAYCYGLSLQKARRLTDEEKERYSEDYKERLFVGLGDHINLNNIRIDDIEDILDRPIKEADGEFLGCGNQAYIITQNMWDSIVAVDADKKAEKEREKKREEIRLTA